MAGTGERTSTTARWSDGPPPDSAVDGGVRRRAIRRRSHRRVRIGAGRRCGRMSATMPAMEHDDLPRRALLQLIASTFGAAALSWDWGAIAQAAHQGHAAAPAGGATVAFLTPAEAADVEAVTAQIIPTDETPGARE